MKKDELDIRQAKVWLYHLLLRKTNEELTDTEVDIAYHLSKDKDIQEILEKARKTTLKKELISERTKLGQKNAKNIGKRGKDKKPRRRSGYNQRWINQRKRFGEINDMGNR